MPFLNTSDLASATAAQLTAIGALPDHQYVGEMVSRTIHAHTPSHTLHHTYTRIHMNMNMNMNMNMTCYPRPHTRTHQTPALRSLPARPACCPLSSRTAGHACAPSYGRCAGGSPRPRSASYQRDPTCRCPRRIRCRRAAACCSSCRRTAKYSSPPSGVPSRARVSISACRKGHLWSGRALQTSLDAMVLWALTRAHT